MALEREIDTIKKTMKYINQIACFGVSNIEKMDTLFKENIQKNIQDLKHIGFIEVARIIEDLIEKKDVKIYIYLEFVLKEIQNKILKATK